MTKWEEHVRARMKESAELKLNLGTAAHEAISEIAEQIVECYRAGGKVLIFGNGGSASDAQHISTELVSKFYLQRRALNAVALTTNTSTLTAIGNDYGFDTVFSRQVEALAAKGDVVIGISTSGNSKNVILALEQARKVGALCVGLSGKKGAKIDRACDIILNVDSTDTPRIQEVHITAGHIICELVERELFGKVGR